MSDEDKRNADESGDPESADPDSGGDDHADADEELTVEDILAEASDDGQAAEDTVSVLQTTLEERTRDLQRLNAEFQNYRKRVERDKARSGELATAAVLSSLLPILDDLDRARDHGDLTGPFGSVAEQLINTLAKQGLESFGEKGDTFDPTVHEAVAHMQMGDVDGPTCIDVMRRGYRLGDRLLRAALVAVAEPLDEPEASPPAEQAGEDDLRESAEDPAEGPDESEPAEPDLPRESAEEPAEGPDESEAAEADGAESKAESEKDGEGKRGD
ncbi:MAG TPA: nucleotide exchange factor GrpE [Glycomyces sp.]|nr:nucleotide exchange factor GrpE [Glycomyces sp.]